jgi:hypothetical protein
VSRPIVYDKGKYHDEEVERFGLHSDQACVHTAFFLGWLIETDHLSDEFVEDSADDVAAYKERNITAVELYKRWDRCLVDDMLNDEGNEFAQSYFDFEHGAFLKDYAELMVKSLASEFHVEYTWENQAVMNERVDQRFIAWLGSQRER